MLWSLYNEGLSFEPVELQSLCLRPRTVDFSWFAVIVLWKEKELIEQKTLVEPYHPFSTHGRSLVLKIYVSAMTLFVERLTGWRDSYYFEIGEVRVEHPPSRRKETMGCRYREKTDIGTICSIVKQYLPREADVSRWDPKQSGLLRTYPSPYTERGGSPGDDRSRRWLE